MSGLRPLIPAMVTAMANITRQLTISKELDDNIGPMADRLSGGDKGKLILGALSVMDIYCKELNKSKTSNVDIAIIEGSEILARLRGG